VRNQILHGETMIEVQLHLHGGPTERQELPTAPSIGSCIHGSQHLQLHPLSDRRADELQASLATWGEQ